MKAADAKAPKFDSKWWAQNKAKAADPKGAFEKALADYQVEKKKFAAKSDIDTLKSLGGKLEEIVKQAKVAKADPKLGALQKETKDAYASYEKLGSEGVKVLVAIAGDRHLKATAEQMVSAKSEAFRAFCKTEFSTENYDFISLNNRKVTHKLVYDKYVVGKLINVGAPAQQALDEFAAAGDDTPARWAKAPWGPAVKDVLTNLGDTRSRFNVWYLKKLASTAKLP